MVENRESLLPVFGHEVRGWRGGLRALSRMGHIGRCAGALLLAAGACAAAAQAGPSAGDYWTWMGGSQTIIASGKGHPGVYGEKGVPSAKNIPGARIAFASWQDRSGHFWIFGGSGFDAGGAEGTVLNDLWEYNPATSEWTWWGGNALQNTKRNMYKPVPGTPGVYGTQGKASATNWPGSRLSPVVWQDAKGDIWLFGGDAIDADNHEAPMNDLWMLNTTTLEWTWMGGSSTLDYGVGAAGVYGTRGHAAPGNIPGSRDAATGWVDREGNLWLFGGFLEQTGYGSPAWCAYSDRNDLWRYSPTTHEWTWMSGNPPSEPPEGGFCQESIAAPPSLGVYGTRGVPSAKNVPGDREQATGWVDKEGNFWLFGGLGYPNNETYGYLNDLWEFDPATNEWTWQGGRDDLPRGGGSYEAVDGGTLGAAGIYGKPGVAAAANAPGARHAAAGAVDANGDLWLMGGVGSDSVVDVYSLNDVWKFSPATKEWTWIDGASRIAEPPTDYLPYESCKNSDYCGVVGSYGLPGIPASSDTPGGRSSSAIWLDDSNDLWLFGGFGIGEDGAPGWLNDFWELRAPETGARTTATLEPASLSFSATLGLKSAAQAVALTNTGSVALAIGKITFAGLNPADYTETNNCGTAVKAKAECTISVVFTPHGAGFRPASLFVVDDATGWPQSIAINAKAAMATPKVTLTASTSSAAKGAKVTFTAVVTGVAGVVPTGTVDLQVGNNDVTGGYLSNGKATILTTQLPAGKDSVTVFYDGDTNYNSAQSAPVVVTVN